MAHGWLKEQDQQFFINSFIHRPSQLTWALSLPVNGCYHPHPPLPFNILTQPNT